MTDEALPVPPEQPHTWRPERFMVIVAHPDDADYGPAGTAATWIRAGSAGWLVCCTSGDQGSEDWTMDPLVLGATREREQRAAAQVVGYEGVTFLHQPDGALANDLALRELLVREIRAFRPDAVLSMDPETVFRKHGRGINHTDHRAAGLAAADAIFPAARNPMSFPHLVRDGLLPHRVRRLYLGSSNVPSAWVDITGHGLETKLAALRCHISQNAHTDESQGHVRERAANEGRTIGVAAAETFRVVVIDPD